MSALEPLNWHHFGRVDPGSEQVSGGLEQLFSLKQAHVLGGSLGPPTPPKGLFSEAFLREVPIFYRYFLPHCREVSPQCASFPTVGDTLGAAYRPQPVEGEEHAIGKEQHCGQRHRNTDEGQ